MKGEVGFTLLQNAMGKVNTYPRRLLSFYVTDAMQFLYRVYIYIGLGWVLAQSKIRIA